MIDRAQWLEYEMTRLCRLGDQVRALRQASAAAPEVDAEARDRKIDELETRVRILRDQVADLRSGSGEVWKLLHTSFRQRAELLSRAVASLRDSMDH